MSATSVTVALNCLRCEIGGHSDRQLLDAYTAANDQAAFAALVKRHGPMVLGVCRRVLRDVHDAEDAFQAVFLVLARKATTLRDSEALTSWLHGVAYRTALRARRDTARRRKHESRVVPQANPPAWEVGWRELQAVLDQEVQWLALPYRAAFVCCCLEGLSLAEAGERLGIKPKTVSCQLARARKRLQQRLARRGISLTAVLAALAVSTTGRAALPLRLVRLASRLGAGTLVTGFSARALSLAEGVTPTMLSIKTQLALLVLVLCVLGTSLGLLAKPETAAPAAPSVARAPAAPPSPTKADSEAVSTFAGRVLDPEGKPVARAKVTFHQRRPPGEEPDFFPKAATGTTDADGRFRFSGIVHLNAPARDRPPMLTLTAYVPGYGPAATFATSPNELKDRTLRLVKDDVPIRGRILNLEGKPIPGVTVRPVAVVANTANDLGRLVKVIETNKWAELPNDQQPNIVFSAAAAGLRQPAVTDSEGRFTLSGFGRERIVVLRLDGPTIETCLLNAMTRRGPAVRATRPRASGLAPPLQPGADRNATYVYAHGASFDFAPGLALVVEGVVRDQDSGKPLAGVVVRRGIAYDFGWAEDELTTTTDARGHYRLAGLSRSSARAFLPVKFVPPASLPYLTARFSAPASELGKPVRLDVRLKRGVLVKGRVTDKATGRPVQAIVTYFAFRDNPNFKDVKGFVGSEVVSSKKDGSFTLAALPGKGIVAARTDDMRRGTYVSGRGGDTIRGLFDARIGGFVTAPYICLPGQFDTLVGIEPGASVESVACPVQLDPGKTVQGTLVDPDGKPLAGVSIRGPFWANTSIRALPTAAFTIPAVNPDKPAAYFFEHPKKKLGAAVLLKGDEPRGFTLKLKPTATITGRVVGEDGEPVRNVIIHGRLEAGQLNMVKGWNGFFWGGRTGADGRFKIEGLLPEVKLGALYQRGNLFSNLTLKPGEIRNLGDLKVKNIPE